MDLEKLKNTARAMVATGKGILAIDESHDTCKKRFDGLGIPCDEEMRRQYRQLLVTAEGAEKYISGYILFDETIRQKTDGGVQFPEVLKKRGILPGIKVDKGAKDFALHLDEKVTEGLDGLRDRLAEYKTLGAEFAKWRAVITIGANFSGQKNLPSGACIRANAHALARYAALCQEADLVPMVEPEVLIDGDHDIARCYEVTAETLKTLFAELAEQGVAPEGTILKTSMVLSGKKCATQADVATVAAQTAKCLRENVPHNLAGIVFLSGGQSDQKATEHLDAINKLGPHPWPVSFSYGRAIQNPALLIWAKNFSDASFDTLRAQQALVKRSELNSLAAQGKYSPSLENTAV